LWDYVIEYSLQNRGYGTKALKELIKFLQINYNCNLMTTTYKMGNLPAKHLYEKLGFVETDVVDDGDIHEVNMVLKL
jgi:diamine N-acetyltransferase